MRDLWDKLTSCCQDRQKDNASSQQNLNFKNIMNRAGQSIDDQFQQAKELRKKREEELKLQKQKLMDKQDQIKFIEFGIPQFCQIQNKMYRGRTNKQDTYHKSYVIHIDQQEYNYIVYNIVNPNKVGFKQFINQIEALVEIKDLQASSLPKIIECNFHRANQKKQDDKYVLSIVTTLTKFSLDNFKVQNKQLENSISDQDIETQSQILRKQSQNSLSKLNQLNLHLQNQSQMIQNTINNSDKKQKDSLDYFVKFINKNEKIKFRIYKNLFTALQQLQTKNLVIQKINTKKLQVNFDETDQMLQGTDNLNIIISDIDNIEEETDSCIFYQQKNNFIHPAYLTFKRNVISHIQDIYSMCLSLIIIESYLYKEEELYNNFFFDQINYFEGIDQHLQLNGMKLNKNKVQLQQYSKQQSANLLNVIKQYFDLQEDIDEQIEEMQNQLNDIENQVLQEQEQKNVQKDDLNQKFSDMKQEVEENNQDFQTIVRQRRYRLYLQLCQENIICYLYLGLNHDVDKIPTAEDYVTIFQHLETQYQFQQVQYKILDNLNKDYLKLDKFLL